MTSISLHPLPDRGGIMRQQISAVAVALRKERRIFFAVLGVLVVLGIAGAVRGAGNHHGMGFSYTVGISIPMVLAALILPFSIWRGEDPARRTYHWAMPIARGPHTLMKVLAGWLWLMVATIVYLLVMVALGAAVGYITGSVYEHAQVPAWQWLVPFTATTIAYFLVTVTVVASDHPWAWIGGILAGYAVVLLLLQALDMRDVARTLGKVVDGQYGLTAALFGHLHDAQLGGPSTDRWLGSVSIWGTIALAGVVTAAYRRRQM